VLRLLFSVGVSLALLAVLLYGLTGSINLTILPRLKQILVTTPPLAILGYLIAALAQAFLRAIRYRILLKATEKKVPGIIPMMLVSQSRNMFVDMLPARLGELSYMAMLNRGYTVRAEACLSSLSLSFVFDLMALAMLIVCILVYQLLSGQPQAWLFVVLFVVLAVVATLLFFLYPFFARFSSWLEQVTASKHQWLAGLARFAQQTVIALRETAQAGILTPVLLLSCGVRLIKYLGLAALFLGIGQTALQATTKVGLAGMLLSLISAEAASSLPLPTFMSFGVYEAGGSLIMTVLGVDGQSAALLMLAVHIWSQCVDYGLGILGLVLIFLSSGFLGTERGKKTAGSSSWGMIPVAVAICIAGILFAGFEVRNLKKIGGFSAPQPGVPLERGRGAEKDKVLQSLYGFVVWSSNRFGNHDIVMLSLPEQKLTRLTTNPHTEYYPRISPDGKRIVFSRSQASWVSQRNPYPWDVYLLDLATGQERLVARNANVPTWSDDGRKVRFQRNGNQFVEYDLATQREHILFETGKNLALAKTVLLETPVWSDARKALAVTLRGSMRATVIIDQQGKIRRVGNGCEINWAPAGSYLFHVDHGGRMDNAFFKVNPDTLRRILWFDSPGEYSHEYFPKVGNTGEFLVYGASKGGHEHDRADYEIFLWKIGSPAASATRLSYYTGNDCWPDIYLYTLKIQP